MKRIVMIIISSILFAFTTGDTKSEYILPLKASSVCSADIDLDGDNDIVVGHNYSSSTDWTGITMMINDGNGYFSIDTFYMNGQHRTVLVDKIDDNEEQDLITQYFDGKSSQIGILLDFVENQNNLISIDITYYADLLSKGDINGDGFIDIVFAFNFEQQWGVIYNDGTGNFTEPEYYNTDLNPNDLAVGDIDGNGRDDIAIAGSNTEIWYSFETGFEKFTFSGYEHSIDLKDMDNDGDLDVITLWGAFTTTVVVYENLGYQSFQPHYVCMLPSTSGGVFTPDLDNDSLADISFLAGGNFKYLFNEGQLIFPELDSIVIPSFTYGLSYTWGDLDNNDCPDILVTKIMGIYAPNLKILFNDGNGNFGENPITDITNPKSKIQVPNIKCYPNPFTTGTTIEFNIKENEFAELSVYDLSGKKVKTLTNNITKGGIVKIKWDGLDNGGKPCKPGPYLLTLKVNGNVLQTIKLIKY